MEMSQEKTAEIDRIRECMRCERDCGCCRSGFTQMGRVRLLADGNLLDCLEERAATCRFSVAFGDGYFCRCPLRTHIATTFHV